MASTTDERFEELAGQIRKWSETQLNSAVTDNLFRATVMGAISDLTALAHAQGRQLTTLTGLVKVLGETVDTRFDEIKTLLLASDRSRR